MTVTMTPHDRDRLKVIEQLQQRQLTQRQAADLKGHASANYAPDTLDELDRHLKASTRGLRRKDHRGLGYLKPAGLLLEPEYLQSCESQ